MPESSSRTPAPTGPPHCADQQSRRAHGIRGRGRKSAIALITGAMALGGGVSMIALTGTANAASSALTANWYESAPYYYTLDSSAPDLGQVMSATGQKAFELAFILAPNGGGCTPTWDGTDPTSSDTQVLAVINEVRADGGDVSVSAGGANGTKLGQECGSASATAAAYQSVISQYSLHAIDFDLEEPEIENASAIADELGAAQILQAQDPGLLVTVTIPTSTSGANYFGQLLLNESKSLGFVPDDYSLMPFDNGFSGGAASQETALTDFNAQLVSTFGWTAAQAWNHEGVSSMNGRSDTGEYFYQADFASMLTFAEQHNMSRYSFWSVNRDRECNPPANGDATSGECSSVTQNAYDFTKYDTQFAQWAPTTPPVAPPPPNAGSCAGAWSSTTVYVGGDVVSYAGHNWTAAYWTEGNTPGTSGSPWTDDGPCGGSAPPTTAPPTTAPPTTAPPTTTPPTTAPPTTTPPTTTKPTTAPPTTTAPTTAPPTTTPPTGGTIVVNGGFETGSLSPWTCDSGTGAVVKSPVHSGSYALQDTPTSSDDAQCTQVIKVAASHTYTLAGWVDGSYVYLGVSGTGTTDTSTWTPGTTGYQSLSVSFTTGASTTSVTVYVHGWYGEPVYYADDISVS
jgi:chitinase